MNIAIYARVSTDGQAKENTIESQLEALREYALAHNLTIVQECIDNGFSGAILSRPGLDQLRDLSLDGVIEGVLALSPDRLSRKQVHQIILLEEFKKRDIQVLFTTQQYTDSPEGNLMLQIQGAVAEFERAKIIDRTRRGTKHAVKKGQVLGSKAPYGYQFIQKTDTALAHWEIDPQEAKIVKLIFDLYVKKGMKGTEIARYLNSEEIPPRFAAKWWSTVIYSILKNVSYLGTAFMYKTQSVQPIKHPQVKKYNRCKNTAKIKRSREDWIGVSVPTLLDQETWDAAQDLLKKNAYRSRRNNNKNKYLLRGLVVCGICGSMAPGYVSNKKTYYSCGAKRNKNITTKPHDEVNIAVRHRPFDEKVWSDLVELLEAPDNLRKQVEKRLPRNNALAKSIKSNQSKIEKEIQRLAVEEKRILDAYRESVIELDELKEQKAKIARTRKGLNAKQKAALSQLEGTGRPDITMSTLGDISGRFQRVMANADFSTREKVANLIINSVVLHDDKAIVSGNIPISNSDALTTSNHGQALFVIINSRLVNKFIGFDNYPTEKHREFFACDQMST